MVSVLVGAKASMVFTQVLVGMASLTSNTMEAVAETVSPVTHSPALGLMVQVTKPSPLCSESLMGRKPRWMSVGGRPVAGSMDWNIQKASLWTMSNPATTSK